MVTFKNSTIGYPETQSQECITKLKLKILSFLFLEFNIFKTSLNYMCANQPRIKKVVNVENDNAP